VPKRLNSEKLFDDRRVAAMARNNPLAWREQIELEHLVEYRFFAFSNMFQKRTNFDEGLKRTGYVLEQSDYVTTMPSIAAEAHMRHFDLVCRQVPEELKTVSFYMVWPRRMESDPLINWTLNLLRQIVGETAQGADQHRCLKPPRSGCADPADLTTS